MRDALPEDVDLRLFRAVVRGTFGKRRKTLRNSLQYLQDEGVTGAPDPLTCPVSLDLRPEALSVMDFIRLTQHLKDNRS